MFSKMGYWQWKWIQGEPPISRENALIFSQDSKVYIFGGNTGKIHFDCFMIDFNLYPLSWWKINVNQS